MYLNVHNGTLVGTWYPKWLSWEKTGVKSRISRIYNHRRSAKVKTRSQVTVVINTPKLDPTSRGFIPDRITTFR